MTETPVLAALANGVLSLTLNRPERLNAMNNLLIAAMNRELERARADDTVRAVLLTGTGRGFCAGADLAGGGANFALACDIVLAARSARFDQAFVRISLMPDLGGTWFLPHLVGDARARALAMLGTSLTAEQAERMGMVWQVVDDASLMAEATKLARRLAAGPTLSYAAIKQAIDKAATNTLDQQLDLERDSQRALGQSADCREGVAAFLAKRPAQFTGR